MFERLRGLLDGLGELAEGVADLLAAGGLRLHAGVDQLKARRECLNLLDAIREVHSTGVTIVWIEHVVHALLSVAERLVVVDFGRKIADGDPATVLASADVQSVYMGAEHG